MFFTSLFPIAQAFKLWKIVCQKAKEEEEIDVDVLDEMVNVIEEEGILKKRSQLIKRSD